MTEGECGTKNKHSFHSNSAIHSRASSSPIRKRLVFSLRLGHARVLTSPRGVIHCARAASLPPGGGLSNTAIILFFNPRWHYMAIAPKLATAAARCRPQGSMFMPRRIYSSTPDGIMRHCLNSRPLRQAPGGAANNRCLCREEFILQPPMV